MEISTQLFMFCNRNKKKLNYNQFKKAQRALYQKLDVEHLFDWITVRFHCLKPVQKHNLLFHLKIKDICTSQWKQMVKIGNTKTT